MAGSLYEALLTKGRQCRTPRTTRTGVLCKATGPAGADPRVRRHHQRMRREHVVQDSSANLTLAERRFKTGRLFSTCYLFPPVNVENSTLHICQALNGTFLHLLNLSLRSPTCVWPGGLCRAT